MQILFEPFYHTSNTFKIHYQSILKVNLNYEAQICFQICRLVIPNYLVCSAVNTENLEAGPKSIKSIVVSDQRSAPLLEKNNLSLNACLPFNMTDA